MPRPRETAIGCPRSHVSTMFSRALGPNPALPPYPTIFGKTTDFTLLSAANRASGRVSVFQSTNTLNQRILGSW